MNYSTKLPKIVTFDLRERLRTNDLCCEHSEEDRSYTRGVQQMSSSPTSATSEGAEGSTRAASASDMSNIQIDEVMSVPMVEVKHAPFQSQPSLRGDLTDEQVKEMGEKMRKENAKKYFSLRVRPSLF